MDQGWTRTREAASPLPSLFVDACQAGGHAASQPAGSLLREGGVAASSSISRTCLMIKFLEIITPPHAAVAMLFDNVVCCIAMLSNAERMFLGDSQFLRSHLHLSRSRRGVPLFPTFPITTSSISATHLAGYYSPELNRNLLADSSLCVSLELWKIPQPLCAAPCTL